MYKCINVRRNISYVAEWQTFQVIQRYISIIHIAGLCVLGFVWMMTYSGFLIASSVPYARWTLSAHWRRFVPDASVQPFSHHECGMDSYRVHEDRQAIVWYISFVWIVFVLGMPHKCAAHFLLQLLFSLFSNTHAKTKLQLRMYIVYSPLYFSQKFIRLIRT